ncbi:MAG: hypothetical protein ACYC2T_13520 [Bacillota bacterium]
MVYQRTVADTLCNQGIYLASVVGIRPQARVPPRERLLKVLSGIIKNQLSNHQDDSVGPSAHCFT